MSRPRAAIVDYRLGNLFSVAAACRRAGMEPVITSQPAEVLAADIVFLPGVGAFGDAMANLRGLGLVEPLRRAAASGRPLVGICLGQQLFMTESYEFGRHRGLGLIPGEVVPFEGPAGPRGVLKVPQVGWNRVRPAEEGGDPWRGGPLEGLEPGSFMYFVHSFYVLPESPGDRLALTAYGDVVFTSALRRGNLVAFQFHPERSGHKGINIYRRLRRMAEASRPAGANP